MATGHPGAAVLADARVLDLARDGAGSLAAAVLGDLGADVIKLVRDDPRLDPGRETPDWIARNRSKRIAREPGAEADAAAKIAELASSADIVIADSVTRLREFGLDPRALSSDRIVLVTPPYTAESTPWFGGRESNELLDARSGIARYQGSEQGGPITSVYPYLILIQGLWAATAALAALVDLRRRGRGELVTVGGLHSALVFADIMFSRPFTEPEPDRAVGSSGSNPMYTRYQCADGEWVFVGGLGPKFSNLVIDVLEMRHILDDPRIGGAIERLWLPENGRWVITAFADRFRERPSHEWIALLEHADIPATVLGRRAEWHASEQMRASGQYVEVEDPVLGEIVMPGPVVEAVAAPARVRAASAAQPLAAMDWLAPAAPRAAAPSSPEHRPTAPLQGMKVAVFGAYVAGPFVGRLLAELGADTIKIEPPTGDPWRIQGFGMNRGYRSISVDLRRPDGREALRRVLNDCDAVVDNFRIGVLDRLELSHDRLVATNPDVVTVAVTAYGERGPLAHKPGYDPVLQAASGMMHAQGGDDEPVVYSLPPNDCATAVCGALAAVAGLYRRTMSGEGIHLSTSLASTSIYLQGAELVDYPGRPEGRKGGADFPGASPFDRFYRVSDGYIRIQAPALDADVLSAAGLAVDPDAFAVDPTAELARVFAAVSGPPIVAALTDAGIPAVVAPGVREASSTPELFENGYLERFVAPSGTEFSVTGRFAGLERGRLERDFLAPGLGEHSSDLLREAGLDESEISRLVEENVVQQGEQLDVVYRPPYR